MLSAVVNSGGMCSMLSAIVNSGGMCSMPSAVMNSGGTCSMPSAVVNSGGMCSMLLHKSPTKSLSHNKRYWRTSKWNAIANNEKTVLALTLY